MTETNADRRSANGRVKPGFNLGDPEKPSPKVTLYNSNDEPIDLTDTGSGNENPFEHSFFDIVGDWLGKHGPAISHLFLIIGSAAGTLTNAIHFATGPEGQLVHTLFATLIFCGLIVEASFAYAWMKQGSTDLAGAQIKSVRDLYNRSSFVMIGDLSLSVASVAIGIGDVAQYWVGIVQPLFAVHLVRLFFVIKGSHPMTIAKQKVATLKAYMEAGAVENEAEHMRLQLDEERHERFMRRAALEQRIAAGEALVSGGWFKRQVKKAVRQSVDKKLLPDVRSRLGKLPELLRLPGSRKN